jgi:hypothetical protein
MTITRVGATKQYSDNWENIFGGNGRSAARKQISSAAAKSAKKKPAKKKTGLKAVRKASRRK